MTKSTDETQPVGTQSLRILMIAPTSFFADYGCHVRILEEIQILQKMGHQVTVVTYHNGNPVAGVDIRRTLSIPWRRDYEVGSSRHKIGFDILLSIKSLEVALREKFDLIHAHLHEGALIGSVLSRLMDIPMVFDFQGSLTEEMVDHGFLRRDSTFFKPLRKLETWLAQSAPRVLTSSFHAERLLIDRFGCQPERLYTLADCVNSDVFRPASTYEAADLQQLRDTLGIPADRKLVVYLGLLAEHQGISHLLQAMQKILQTAPNVHLLLMGFPGVVVYQQMSHDLGIADHVTMPGRIPYAEAPRYLALGDVAVAPKLSSSEGSGKLLNYMAVGLPTVAFKTPVAQEYLGRDGIFAVSGDVEDLAQKLADCLYPQVPATEWKEIGMRLRQRVVQNFSWEQAGHRIVAIYEELLAGSTRIPTKDAKPKSEVLTTSSHLATPE